MRQKQNAHRAALTSGAWRAAHSHLPRPVVPVDEHKDNARKHIVPGAADRVGAEHDKEAVLQHDERDKERAAVHVREEQAKGDAEDGKKKKMHNGPTKKIVLTTL